MSACLTISTCFGIVFKGEQIWNGSTNWQDPDLIDAVDN